MELHIYTDREIETIDKAKKQADAIRFLVKYKTVLHLLSVGKVSEEIARIIYKDKRTVEHIVYRLMKISGTKNRVHLVATAFRLNILKMNEV